MVPADAILDLVVKRQPAGTDLLRAEILLTTPSAFVLPRDWQGSADRPERQASLEYIEVQSTHLGEYRDVMRDYFGPAAAKLVRANRIGTFRAMETAAVLYRDPGLKIDWNQIHLCEVDAGGFDGFSQEFGAALQEVSPDGEALLASSPASTAYARFAVGPSTIPWWRRTLRSGGKALRNHERNPARIGHVAEPVKAAGIHQRRIVAQYSSATSSSMWTGSCDP